MKTINKNTLKICFWFGMNTPKNGDDILTVEIDFEGKGYSFSSFERDYELFKQKNLNPEVSYKSSIDNEECYIFFPEPVGAQLTTINEVRLLSLMFKSFDSKTSDLESKLAEL